MNIVGDILGVGTSELLIILVIVLLLFGGKKLPQLFRSAGTSVRELRKGLEGEGEGERKKPAASTDTSNQ